MRQHRVIVWAFPDFLSSTGVKWLTKLQMKDRVYWHDFERFCKRVNLDPEKLSKYMVENEVRCVDDLLKAALVTLVGKSDEV